MRCAKRSSAALRTAMTLEASATDAQIDGLPIADSLRIPSDLNPVSVVLATGKCAPVNRKRAKTDSDPGVYGSEKDHSASKLASEVAKLRRDVKNALEQTKHSPSCGDAPLVRVGILGRAVRIYGEWVSLCTTCGCLCSIASSTRFGGDICCGRCDFAMLFGKEAQLAIDAIAPKPAPKACRFCGKVMPKAATGRWVTVKAPADCGGKNANVPPPLRTATYCPAHYKNWIAVAHCTMPTQVIFSHLMTKAKPIFGAEQAAMGRVSTLRLDASVADDAQHAHPTKKRSAQERRKDQLARRIGCSKKRKAQT